MTTEVGKKIKALRLASDLTQEELANRAMLTKGFISQLESEKFETSISIESLSDIVGALGISLSEFFTESKETQIVYNKNDRIPIENTGVSRFELLVPGSTNNVMDPIMVELLPGEELEKRAPHPGEQFGYVLKGTVTLLRDTKKYTIGKDCCFSFESDKVNQLKNNSQKPAQLLWIVTPPQM